MFIDQRRRQVTVELDHADDQVRPEADAGRLVDLVTDGRLNIDRRQLDVVDQVRTVPVGRPFDLVAVRRVDAKAPGQLVRYLARVIGVDGRTQRVIGLFFDQRGFVLIDRLVGEQCQSTGKVDLRFELGQARRIEKDDLGALAHRDTGVTHGQCFLSLRCDAVAAGVGVDRESQRKQRVHDFFHNPGSLAQMQALDQATIEIQGAPPRTGPFNRELAFFVIYLD